MSMSIQSDVEILSVQAVEYYAQKHHLSEGEVFDLFCKHQVFEKILIQHEMLHQLDMWKKSSKKVRRNWCFIMALTSHLRG